MPFLVQFIGFRRGAPAPLRTLAFDGHDPLSALRQAKVLIAGRSFPVRTEALRVMDDRGRTLIDWTMPVAADPPTSPSVPASRTEDSPSWPTPAHTPEKKRPEAKQQSGFTQRHQFEAGQPISYSEGGRHDVPIGGFEIVELCDASVREPSYLIRSAEETSDRRVKEHELQEDLGARVRGR